MMRFILFLSFLISFASVHAASSSKDKEGVQGRLSYGRLFASPETLNSEMTSLGQTKFGNIDRFQIEITYPVLQSLDLGVRFDKNFAKSSSTTVPSYRDNTSLDQTGLQLLMRVPLLKKEYIRFDIFGSYGGSNTSIEIKSNNKSVKLEKSGAFNWSGTEYSSYGATLGLGLKGYYLYAEGGVLNSKVDSFEKSGELTTNVNSLDLSGKYVVFGVIFDSAYIEKATDWFSSLGSKK